MRLACVLVATSACAHPTTPPASLANMRSSAPPLKIQELAPLPASCTYNGSHVVRAGGERHTAVLLQCEMVAEPGSEPAVRDLDRMRYDGYLELRRGPRIVARVRTGEWVGYRPRGGYRLAGVLTAGKDGDDLVLVTGDHYAVPPEIYEYSRSVVTYRTSPAAIAEQQRWSNPGLVVDVREDRSQAKLVWCLDDDSASAPGCGGQPHAKPTELAIRWTGDEILAAEDGR